MLRSIIRVLTTKDNKLAAIGISQGVAQFAAVVISAKINQPASLLANKDMYLVYGIISLLLALMVSLFRRIQHPRGNLVGDPIPFELYFVLTRSTHFVKVTNVPEPR
jgi:hypothetical protein